MSGRKDVAPRHHRYRNHWRCRKAKGRAVELELLGTDAGASQKGRGGEVQEGRFHNWFLVNDWPEQCGVSV